MDGVKEYVEVASLRWMDGWMDEDGGRQEDGCNLARGQILREQSVGECRKLLRKSNYKSCIRQSIGVIIILTRESKAQE